MNTLGSIVGAGVFIMAYTLLLITYFVRFIKKYPRDRGIRIGSIALIVFLCMIVAYRLPELEEIRVWLLPLLFFSDLVLVFLSLFFIVEETVIDIRKSHKKRHEG